MTTQRTADDESNSTPIEPQSVGRAREPSGDVWRLSPAGGDDEPSGSRVETGTLDPEWLPVPVRSPEVTRRQRGASPPTDGTECDDA
jgi:hypothetical protein